MADIGADVPLAHPCTQRNHLSHKSWEGVSHTMGRSSVVGTTRCQDGPPQLIRDIPRAPPSKSRS
eukprot:15466439-Alexandrium_andersonii.AAC.1